MGGMIVAQGCSVAMASKEQTRKDLSVLRIGGDRDDIIQVIGAPYITTRNDDGSCKDVYKIVEDAQSKEGKTLAVVGHAAMDVVTLGLWEIAGTPLELATKQEATTFILYYGPDNKLKAYDAIK
jgi:hypothetical protein